MTIKLQGSSSGHVSLDAKATAANNTITLPDTANGELVAADSSGHINLADGKEIKLGTGGDLTITHDGANASISNDTGAFVIQDSHAGANAIIVRKGAEVELLHNNVLACETSANGLAFPSGKGIDFSATSDVAGKTSELLDDYEEGTFTPTWAQGASSITYHTQKGFYTKIGRYVYGHIYLYTSCTADAANLRIGGLPFTTGAQTSVGYGGAVINYTSANFFSDFPILHMPNANTLITFYKMSGGIDGNTTGINGKEIIVNFFYHVD